MGENAHCQKLNVKGRMWVLRNCWTLHSNFVITLVYSLWDVSKIWSTKLHAFGWTVNEVRTRSACKRCVCGLEIYFEVSRTRDRIPILQVLVYRRMFALLRLGSPQRIFLAHRTIPKCRPFSLIGDIADIGFRELPPWGERQHSSSVASCQIRQQQHFPTLR